MTLSYSIPSRKRVSVMKTGVFTTPKAFLIPQIASNCLFFFPNPRTNELSFHIRKHNQKGNDSPSILKCIKNKANLKQSEKRFWSLGLQWTIYTYIYWFYWAKLLQETSNILLRSPFVKLSYPKRSTTNYNQRSNKDCKSARKYRFHKPKCQNSCVKIVSYDIQRRKVCYYKIVSLGVFERPLFSACPELN